MLDLRLPSLLLLLAPPLFPQVTELFDGGGNGIQGFDTPLDSSVAVDGAGNVYVSGSESNNVFRITPEGEFVLLIDANGDRQGNTLDGPSGIAVDDHGIVYVAGRDSNNVFAIDPLGNIRQILDAEGDSRTGLNSPLGLAVDSENRLIVVSWDAVFRLGPDELVVLLDSDGAGLGSFTSGQAVAIDDEDNIYVVGCVSDNAFRISPSGAVSIVIDSSGAGPGQELDCPVGITVDGLGSVYVSGVISDNLFEIEPGGTITELVAGQAAPFVSLSNARGVVADEVGNVYVTSFDANQILQVAQDGTVARMMSTLGDNAGNWMDEPIGIAMDSSGRVIVAAKSSDNVFRFDPELASREIVRLGEPPNPLAFRPSGELGPVIGENWNPSVDHFPFAPGALTDTILVTPDPLNALVPELIGTLLCAPTASSVLITGLGSFSIPIPDDTSLLGLELCTQALSMTPDMGLHLANALDITIGAF